MSRHYDFSASAFRRALRDSWTICGALFLASSVHCAADTSSVGCDAIRSTPDGIRVDNCDGGSITLTDIAYDRGGAKRSYDFLVTCNGKSVRGAWSRTDGVSCLQGDSDPCKSGGVCTPKSAEDCRNIANCKEWGDCGYDNGKCVPTEEGCVNSQVSCGLSGACHLGPSGVCIVTSNTDCQAPFGVCPQCEFKGPCATYGDCYAENGICIAKDGADCRKSTQCAFAGLCSLGMNDCIATSDADCTMSEVCRTAGQCRAVGGICAPR